MKPTIDQTAGYQAAFDYFNAKLFAGELPPCVLNFSRLAKSRGFFQPLAWCESVKIGKQQCQKPIPEISLNPDLLGTRTQRETFSTLVHEMCHHWQDAFGKPSRGGYHNREWAEKMKQVGLYPSDSGSPGGKETGPSMTHYIMPGGVYEQALAAMPESVRLPWCTVPRVKLAKAKRSKTPYMCPGCGARVWGKPGLSVECTECDEIFEEM